ncbi:MAG: metallophosphoesterase [Candidatus Thorarchaeota archaeon]
MFEDRGLIIRGNSLSALIISDLHLGIEEEISEERGIHFPLQDVSILERIKSLVKKYELSSLYIVGDVKHTILTDIPYNWDIIPEFMETLVEIVETVIIPGNHDGNLEPLLPRSVELADVHGIVIGKGDERIGLLHGHAWPAPDLLEASRFIAGHSHPAVSRFRTVSKPEIGRSDRRRYAGSVPVVLNSKLSKNCIRQRLGILEIPDDNIATLTTLPSFNQLISGIAVNSPRSKFQGPLFENSCVDVLESEIYSTDGLYLGTIGWMRERFNEMIKSKPECE